MLNSLAGYRCTLTPRLPSRFPVPRSPLPVWVISQPKIRQRSQATIMATTFLCVDNQKTVIFSDIMSFQNYIVKDLCFYIIQHKRRKQCVLLLCCKGFPHIGKLANGWSCLKSPYNALQTLEHWVRHVCIGGAGAHHKEPATPILSLCHSIFTDRSIFSLNLLWIHTPTGTSVTNHKHKLYNFTRRSGRHVHLRPQFFSLPMHAHADRNSPFSWENTVT